MKSEKAFTLIEMLIVLMMIMVLTVLLVPSMYKMIKKYEVKTFFKHIESDLLFIQNETMSTGTTYSLVLLTDETSYVILDTYRIIVKRVKVPKVLTYSSSDQSIRFNKRGTVMNPRTIVFRYGDERYKLTFPLGKAGHYFEKF